MLQQLKVLLVVRGPKLNTVFEVQTYIYLCMCTSTQGGITLYLKNTFESM